VSGSRALDSYISSVALCSLFVSPPENDSFRKDLCFSADVYLFLLEREISEMRGPTGVKFCTMVSTRPDFIMPVQNFGGGAPQKNFRGQKHAKFGPISDDLEVRRRISPKRMNIFKIGFLFLYRDSSCVRRNKSGKVWSSDLGDLNVESYPPKVHFSEDHFSAPRGCCAPKFLHALENHQVLLAHSPTGTGPPYNFFKRGSKIALKCSVLDKGYLEPKGVAS